MTKKLIEQIHREIADLESGAAAPSRAWELRPDGRGGFTRHLIHAKDFQRTQKAAWEKNIEGTRHKLGLSQDRFARLLGISVRTLQHWEQGRRKPSGAARILLRIAVRHPEVVLAARTPLWIVPDYS
jgi:putative transcriptional regulator